MTNTNPYYPDKNLLDSDFKKNYYKYSAVVTVDNISYLIDGCLVKKRGWELAIYPLRKKHTNFLFQTSDYDAFGNKHIVLDFIPRSIFLFPAKDKEALCEAFFIVHDYLITHEKSDIHACLEALDDNPRLNELCSLPCQVL